MLAVKNHEPLWADAERGSAQVAARRLAEEIPDDQWQRLSAGDGSQGPRLEVGEGLEAAEREPREFVAGEFGGLGVRRLTSSRKYSSCSQR